MPLPLCERLTAASPYIEWVASRLLDGYQASARAQMASTTTVARITIISKTETFIDQCDASHRCDRYKTAVKRLLNFCPPTSRPERNVEKLRPGDRNGRRCTRSTLPKRDSC